MTFWIEEDGHKDICHLLYILAFDKGGFGLSKNRFSFFICCLCHFLWAFKVLVDFFTKQSRPLMTQKTLNACRKWYRYSMKFSKPFLESPNPPLLTAKRYKGWQMSLYPSSLIQKVNFVSSLFSDHQHFWPWLYILYIYM